MFYLLSYYTSQSALEVWVALEFLAKYKMSIGPPRKVQIVQKFHICLSETCSLLIGGVFFLEKWFLVLLTEA